MNSGFSFGQYYPASSVIHRMDPRCKIILTIAYMVAIFLVKSYLGYLVTAVLLFSTVALSKVPLKVVVRSIRAVIFLLVFTLTINLLFYKQGEVIASWWKITITWQGIDFAIKMLFRLTLLVMGASMLTFTTTATELTDGLESLMYPLKFIKVPVHDIAIIMSIALRFIPTLVEETQKIMNAQKARGAELDTGNFFKRVKAMLPILIPLFVSAFRRADELADALDARCYNASDKRTKMKVLKFRLRDYIGLLIVALFIAAICVDAYAFGGAYVDNLIIGLIKGAL
ncbi:MAG: energy-coupling factor transporter transmembrane protein EcfT [Clostridia bacterium]|nr:energy-coupling factor transporter transmembrane protein EcfT [Clostridia bacterium]